MDGNKDYLLINYLDRTLEEQEMREIEELINADTATRQQWQYLQLAVQAVEYAALCDQVAAVKEQYKTVHPTEVINPVRKRVISMYAIYRVAACILFMVVAIAGFKYATTNATNMYKEAYVPYTLGTVRGSHESDAMAQAYRNQNWQQVIADFNQLTQKDNKALFLAGMANLELRHFKAADHLFEQVLANNAKTGDDYFQDEAQYYLAMSYLAGNRAKEALDILKQIRANKQHLFHEQASQISSTEIKILEYKYGK